MRSYINRTKYILLLFIVFGFSPVWAVFPLNIIQSDSNGNTAGGTSALFNTFAGKSNTAFGIRALQFNSIGNSNTAFGAYSLRLNQDGERNTASGFSALYSNGGDGNTASGYRSLANNSEGNLNTAFGDSALISNLTGKGNTAIGARTLIKNVNSNFNLAIGYNAGSELKTGGNNIYLSNIGVAAEQKTIRIGNIVHTRAFIGGIRGIKTGLTNAVQVFIDSNGQLGTVKSSARFKKDIKDMSEASHNLMKLRPVTYRYKEPDDNGANPLEYGLIAEEVAKVYPDLAANGADGQIETVQYQKLTPMMLNELQHLNAQLQSEKQKNKLLAEEVARMKTQFQEVAELKNQMEELKSQTQAIKVLTARLSRMEAQQTSGIQGNAVFSDKNRKSY